MASVERQATGSSRGGPASPGEAALPLRYVESSALVATLLEGDVDAGAAIRVQGRRITSALTLTEANRAVVRARADGRLTEGDQRRAAEGLRTFARRCELVAVTEEILTRAGRPFPLEPIRTLDAIHLATVEIVGGPPHLVTVVTRDRRVADNAVAMGCSVAP